MKMEDNQYMFYCWVYLKRFIVFVIVSDLVYCIFNILLKSMSRIVELLFYTHLNQACCVKWNSKNSTDFSVSNGVKQGAVISPILFRSFMKKKIFKQLKRNSIRCHIGPVYGVHLDMLSMWC